MLILQSQRASACIYRPSCSKAVTGRMDIFPEHIGREICRFFSYIFCKYCLLLRQKCTNAIHNIFMKKTHQIRLIVVDYYWKLSKRLFKKIIQLYKLRHHLNSQQSNRCCESAVPCEIIWSEFQNFSLSKELEQWCINFCSWRRL